VYNLMAKNEAFAGAIEAMWARYSADARYRSPGFCHFNPHLGRAHVAQYPSCKRDQAQPAIRPGEPHRLESVLFARCGIHNQGAAVVVIRCHSRYHYLRRGIALTLVASGIAAGPVTLTEAGAPNALRGTKVGV
jgi:hypothetical protein